MYNVYTTLATITNTKNRETLCIKDFPILSLLSDSNQRPRDYKSRALAN